MRKLGLLLPLRVGMIILCSAMTSTAQIAQDHPELCGTQNVIPIPAGLAITSDSALGTSDIVLNFKGTTVRIKIPGAAGEVRQVCPLSRNRVLIFAMANPAVYNIAVVDVSAGTLVDSFYAFSPVLSPNQEWLIMRKFYPPTAASEEYLLYDLRKDRRENRGVDITADNMVEIGRAVFPLGQRNLVADNIGVPETQVHEFRSNSFFWAPDSRTVVFADSAQNRLSIIIVTIGDDGLTGAYIHPVHVSDVCGSSGDISSIKLANADFAPAPGGQLSMFLKLEAREPPGCGTKVLTLHVDDFGPAPNEVHTLRRGKPSAIDEQ